MTGILALADGTIFYGKSLGYEGETVGEVVFNTAMTGYQEIITDPSYAGQIVTLTYPHIGNVGCNEEDNEYSTLWSAGLIVRDVPIAWSNWRGKESLDNFLKRQKLVGISGIDTRQLIHHLRQNGAQTGCISTVLSSSPETLIEKARAFPSMEGKDLAALVSTKRSYVWTKGSEEWSLSQTNRLLSKLAYAREVGGDSEHRTGVYTRVHENSSTDSTNKFSAEVGFGKKSNDFSPFVIVYDYGVKQHILEILVDLGCRVLVVPAITPVKEVLNQNPDGILLSNGPGDPKVCDYAISAIQELMEQDIPLLGICLGFQLMALAGGAQTYKMKFGHHGANHPVTCVEEENRVMITSQNHGFAVDEKTLPSDFCVTHRSLFDQSLQGFRHRYKPFFGFQGHPEASPGPQESYEFFKIFFASMHKRK